MEEACSFPKNRCNYVSLIDLTFWHLYTLCSVSHIICSLLTMQSFCHLSTSSMLIDDKVGCGAIRLVLSLTIWRLLVVPTHVLSNIDATLIQLFLKISCFFPHLCSYLLIFNSWHKKSILDFLKKYDLIISLYAANLVLLPFSFIVSPSGETSKSPLAESSLNILLTLIHFRRCVTVEPGNLKFYDNGNSDSLLKEEISLSENPYCKALEYARDVECKSLYFVLLHFFECLFMR